jgi:hypothetical protein
VFERYIADDIEASASIDQHVVEPDVGDGGSRDKRQHPVATMFSGQSDGPKEMVVLFHHWWGAAFGVPGFTESTSRRRVLMSRWETSSELPPYMTYSLLRRSSPPNFEVRLVEETLEVFVWGLIPQLPLRRGCIGIGGLLLAGPPRRGGAFPGGLVTPLAKALRELLDLAALGGAVASPRMNRLRPGVSALLTWVLAAGVLAPGRCCCSNRTSYP